MVGGKLNWCDPFHHDLEADLNWVAVKTEAARVKWHRCMVQFETSERSNYVLEEIHSYIYSSTRNVVHDMSPIFSYLA